MRTGRAALAEAVRALVVLALFLLTVVHAPAVAGDGFTQAAATSSFCGGAPGGDHRDHPTCAACRIGAGADLSPPCPTMVRAQLIAEAGYVPVAIGLIDGIGHHRPQPTGPPRS